MRKERIEEVTLLRAMAFLAIVLQHSIGEYIYRQDIGTPDAIMLGMLFHFTRYGTLMFVFLSAMLMFYKDDVKIRYGQFIKKRFTDIFVPFMIWTFIYTWAVLGSPFQVPNFGGEYFFQLISPTYGYQLWFVVMIFQFYLLFPLISRVARYVRDRWITVGDSQQVVRKVGWLLLCCAVLYGGLLWFSYYRLYDIGAGATGLWKWLIEHRTLNVLFYFFYIVLGAVCAYGIGLWRKFVAETAAWHMLIFVGVYIWMGYALLSYSTESITLSTSTYLRPITFVLIVPQIFVMYAIALNLQRFGGMMQRLLRWIGTYSFGGFLVHALVLSGVSIFTRQLGGSGYHLWMTIVTFVLVAAISLLLTKLISMLPFSRWIIGGTGKRSKRMSQQSSGQTAVQPHIAN